MIRRLGFPLLMLAAACATSMQVDAQTYLKAIKSGPFLVISLTCIDEMEPGVTYPTELSFYIDRDGHPNDVKIVRSTNDCLAEYSKSSVEQTTFDPQVLRGYVALRLNYTLKDGAAEVVEV